MNNRNTSCMFLNPIIESEVTKVLKSCKNKVSQDCDNLSMNLLKEVFIEIKCNMIERV